MGLGCSYLYFLPADGWKRFNCLLYSYSRAGSGMITVFQQPQEIVNYLTTAQ